MTIRVKVTTTYPDWPLLRQTPGSQGIWGNCQFFVDDNTQECDYWIVCDGLLDVEQVDCPRGNTIFIAGEPPTVKTYDPGFLSQFATVIACDRDIKHPNVIYYQQGLPWHIGRRVKGRVTLSFSKDYDEMKSKDRFRKDKQLSVIASNLCLTQGHARRQDFARKLKNRLGARIDLFGRGFREIEDKWDGLSRYQYHVVIENSSFKDYWTEKLADAFLAHCYPFYYGCPNIYDYFPARSLTVIDINDFEGSLSIIEDAITTGMYRESYRELAEARALVLDKYNLFALIDEICSTIHSDPERADVVLRPETWFLSNKARKRSFLRSVMRCERS